MSTFILLLLFSGPYSTTATTVDGFTTDAACVRAAKSIRQRFTSETRTVEALCFEVVKQPKPVKKSHQKFGVMRWP